MKLYDFDPTKYWKPSEKPQPVAKAEPSRPPVAPLRSCHRCGANTNSMLDRTYRPTCGVCWREMFDRGLLGPDQGLLPTISQAQGDALERLTQSLKTAEQRVAILEPPKQPEEFIEPSRARIPDTNEEV